jgi:predicted 2-oxoglutarate/Fe(II)-dependent dioxygenase YbiX
VWKEIIVDQSSIESVDFDSLLNGNIPAIVVRNFYDRKQCKKIVEKIENSQKSFFQKKLQHIGPFLMSYATKKKEYFDNAKNTRKTFEDIFSQTVQPTLKISKIISKVLPEYFTSLARESGNDFSPYVIRIHENGKSIPIHKDNVKYEGKEYDFSGIDHQLSCIVHLQEPQNGGQIVIFNKQWSRNDEKRRNIDFGYSEDIVSTSEFCKISNLCAGDLVMINPNHYHKVTPIQGYIPRITLGMFLGLYKKEQRIVVWA